MDNVTFNEIINEINEYIDDNQDSSKKPDAEQLKQFHRSYFYNNWLVKFRRLQSFSPLGTRGVIAIPNTTFEEWLFWFQRWAEAFTDNYNKFKKLVYEALVLHEKHLEQHDKDIEDINNQITEINKKITELENKTDSNTDEISKLKDQISDLQQQLNSLKANMFNVSFTGTSTGTLTNGWYMKDSDPSEKGFGLIWGWNNEQDHTQGIHWIPILNYIYKDNATFNGALANDAEIGTVAIPQEVLNEGFTIGESWIYSGFVVQSGALVATSFIHLIPQAGNTIKICILNTTRAGSLPDNLGTIQINVGGTPTQYVTK